MLQVLPILSPNSGSIRPGDGVGEYAVCDQNPVDMTDRPLNQTFILGDGPVHNYDIWVVIEDRDTHLIIQARDSLQARAIAEHMYGRCYGVTLLD